MESTTQIYLMITPERGAVKDVRGEAMAGGYETRIDITSFDLGFRAKENTVKGAQKPDVVGNLDWDSITISKVFDDASLSLAGMLSRHASFEEAKIAVDQQYVESEGEKERNEVLIISLRSGRVADYSLRTSEGKQGASMIETVELSFHKFSITYYAYEGEKGKLGGDYRLGRAYFESHRDEQQD